MTTTSTRRPRVLVTGGSGKLGRAVITELVEHGYRVANLDQAPPPTPNCPFVRVDLTDYGQTVSALAGVDSTYGRADAVVHLAAIPAPGLTTNHATLTNNLACTHNVLSAVRTLGIRSVVWASSETLLGLPFDTPPPYLPVDEDVPPRPESSYSLSKLLEETMAAQLCRWDPELAITALRFSNVMEPHDYAAFPAFDADPAVRRWNLWSYIDARDGAQAVRLALKSEAPGFRTYVIANPDTVMSRSSAELVAAEFPDVEVRGELGHHQALMSSEKAVRELGWTPEYSWRDAR